MEGVDGSVGTIVWVRRRNGSWWPGRILGQDELSASHLMSPRSGTPVKLLGREDASVDWYNLEKSKRVKAFRCGEFDACIERAEASQGIPIKKREKYARREDAILHALELEKQQMAMKHKELGITSDVTNNKTLGARRREFNSFPSSYDYMRDDEPGVHSKFANHKSQMFSKKAALSHDEEDNLYVRKAAKSKKATSAEHNPEALPRLRGLQDFGLRIAPPKKKFSQSTWVTSYKPVNNHVSVHSTAGHMMGSANHAGGSKTSLPIKRKISQGAISEDYLVKKRDRRRPLVQVLQSSAQLPVSHSFQSGYDSAAVSTQGEIDHMSTICRAKRSRCVYLPAYSNGSLDNGGSPSEQIPVETQFGTGDYLGQSGALAEDDTSSATEETESDSSETDSSESDMDENGLRDTTQLLLPGSRNCESPDIHISENFGDPHDDEKSHPGYMPLVHRQDHTMNATADVGVSKWHMKGKRNVRHLPKRPMDPMDGRILFRRANGFVQGTTYENRGSSLKNNTEPFSHKAAGQSLYHKREAYDYAFDGGDILEREGHNHSMGYGNQRYSLTLQADKDHGRSQNSFNDSDSDSHLLSPSLWEADGPSSRMRRAYWDEAGECYNPFYAGTFSDEMDLIDVDLKVQAATYQGEHVPLVSLMSRLNGKAIIGHPVQIEILEDGSTGQLLAKYGAELDESAPPSAVWKTARRSVMLRVPRSSASASALEGEDNDPLPDSGPEGKPSPSKSYSGCFNHQARLAKKSVFHSRQPSVAGKKFQKKPLKRVNLSSQKTRTLSSLANEHRRGAENGGGKHLRQSDLLAGLIRPDGAAPLVTCVPVKVVFSRILEAVNRPSSASAHRARMANPAVRGPP